MALLVLTSAAGSPGVTTLALGLALTWPRSVVLVDADPSAGQAILAGYFRGQSRTGKGLLRVAEAHRDRRPLREVVMDQTIALTDEAEDETTTGPRFLPGFSKPGSAALFTPVWPELADTLQALDAVEIDVIIDAGRTTAAGIPEPLLMRAATVAMVTRTSLRAVAATRVHAAPLREHCALLGAEDQLSLILVGDGKPYTGKEISSLLGLPVAATVADDAVSAAHLSDGARRPRKFTSAPLSRSLHHAAERLDQRLRTGSERMERVA